MTDKYDYDRFGKQGKRVGQAVTDIMEQPYYPQQVGETFEAMAPKYIDELVKSAQEGQSKFTSPFYITVLRKKEPWAVNVLRQWYIARQSLPSPYHLRLDYPNHDHDVFEVDMRNDEIKHLWTLPTAQDSATILGNAALYDSSLVETILKYNQGTLLETFESSSSSSSTSVCH